MKKVSLIFLSLSIIYYANAQIEDMINPSDLKQQTIITEPATLNKGFFRTGITANYGVADRIFDDSGERANILGSSGWATQLGVQFNLTYGLLDRLEIITEIPYRYDRIFYTQFIELPGPDSSFTKASKTKGSGLGDVSVGAEFQILKEDERMPSVSVMVFVTLPTGRRNPENVVNSREFDMAVGEGETTLDLRLQARKIIYPYSFTFYSSYLYHFEGRRIFNPGENEVSFKSGNRLYLGGSFNLHLNDWIALMNEISYLYWWNDEYYGITARDQGKYDRYSISYAPSLVFQIRRFRFFETVRLPLIGKNLPADPFYIFGLQYTF